MSSSLDTIRYHSGIAGEEVAEMVDSLEREVSTLREQVEKLTKERNAFQDQCIRLKNDRAIEKGQLAALAEQNAKMRKVLLRLACLGNGDQYGNSIGNCIAQEALSLPDLATPILNKIKAEAYREAAMHCSKHGSRTADEVSEDLFANADELEQSN